MSTITIPRESAISPALEKFSAKKDELILRLEREEREEYGNSQSIAAARKQETKVKNETEVMTALKESGLTAKILSHQAAATQVHSRELEALQLKYATKKDELEAAHATHRKFKERDAAILDQAKFHAEHKSTKAHFRKATPKNTKNDNDDTYLREEYNLLVQKVAASRSVHFGRVKEVIEAQETEIHGIRREIDALLKSLSEIEATYQASVKTLETQLLLLLRSKLEVEYTSQLQAQEQKILFFKHQRDEQKLALAKLRAEYAELLRQLEKQQAEYAARVAAAAREALAKQRTDNEEALATAIANAREERARLEADLDQLRNDAHLAQHSHSLSLEEIRKEQARDLDEARKAHAARLEAETARRGAQAQERVAAARKARLDEINELESRLRTARDRLTKNQAEARDIRGMLQVFAEDKPHRRETLEKQHLSELARLRTERSHARADADARHRHELDGVVATALADERARGAAELDRARSNDPELARLRTELTSYEKGLAEAEARAAQADINLNEKLSALNAAHSSNMAQLDMEMGGDDAIAKQQSGTGDEALNLAAARANELLNAENAAIAEQLRADCAAYADALAALQRALEAERGAHGAEVRRKQAELDAKESELALLGAENAAFEERHSLHTTIATTKSLSSSANQQGDSFSATKSRAINSKVSTTQTASSEALEICRKGASVLSASRLEGDDPIAAEWRRMVATERAKIANAANPRSSL